MKIAGIIAEFNPFHNGHAALCDAVKDSGADRIIAVMSGNFTQRGDFAAAEKRIRAACALSGGVDLVTELPVAWAVSPAAAFARGGIGLLEATGCVDILCFGSECADEKSLRFLSSAIASPETEKKLREFLATGNITFAKARQNAVRAVYGDKLADILSSPNDLLAVEYLRSAARTGFSPELFIFKRKGINHDSQTPVKEFASASFLRAKALQGELPEKYIPPEALMLLNEAKDNGFFPADNSRLERAVLAKLRMLSPAELRLLPDISEGLENRLYNAIRISSSVAELEFAVKTKRYTLARVRRLILSAFLGIKSGDADGRPPYLRILGRSKGGLDILAKMKTTAALPVDTSLKRLSRLGGACERTAARDAAATDLYTLALPKAQPCGFDFTGRAVVGN